MVHFFDKIHEINDGKFKWSRHEYGINKISLDKKGRPVLLFDDYKGVRIYDNIELNSYFSIFTDISASAFIEDKDNGYWVGSLDKGLFYIKNTKIKYISPHHKTKFYTHITTDDNHMLYTATYDGVIDKYNIQSRYTDIMHIDSDNEFFLVDFNNFINALWVSNSADILSIDVDSKKKNSYINSFGSNGFSTKCIRFRSEETLLLKHDKSLNSINNNFTQEKLLANLGRSIPSRIYDIIQLKNKSWYISTQEGVYEADSVFDKVELVNDSLLMIRIDQMMLMESGDIYMASKGDGLIIRYQDGSTISINEKAGLISNQIEDIALGNDKSIWIASLLGISKVSLGDDITIQNYNKDHGLPVPDVYAIEWYHGKLYAATSKGLIEISESELNKKTIAPRISVFEVNGEDKLGGKNFTYDADENTIFLKYSSINFKLEDNQIFRYRINESQWVKTKKDELYLIDLPPNSYKIEFQSRNEDGLWSRSSIASFIIASPWYTTWWFYLGIGLAGASALTFHFTRREKRLKSKNEVQEKMRSLEKAALQSQMNPHFIFNCLNSIQRFIMDNDKLTAMDYLSRFAKLIRLTLNASVEQEISIYHEKQMLEYYLGLEKLRFKNKFDYTIDVDHGIDMLHTYISPLLIQPLVENAIKHGMKDIDENGKILVQFTKSDDGLLITVRDNGNGIGEHNFTDGHKSLGMKIISDRIGDDSKLNITIEEGWTIVSILL